MTEEGSAHHAIGYADRASASAAARRRREDPVPPGWHLTIDQTPEDGRVYRVDTGRTAARRYSVTCAVPASAARSRAPVGEDARVIRTLVAKIVTQMHLDGCATGGEEFRVDG